MRPIIQAIVFDFDGVLADSEPLHFRAMQELLASLGIPLTTADYYDRYAGFDDVGAFRLVAAEQGWEMDRARLAALVEEKGRTFEALVAATDVLFPAVIPCLDRLAPHYPLAIASGALKHEIRSILRRHAIEDRFRFIVASGDTPHSKPAPDPYVRAAELHGLPPGACLAIEDTRWGIVSARGAGMKCVGITTTYRADELGETDAIIDSLDQLTPSLIAAL